MAADGSTWDRGDMGEDDVEPEPETCLVRVFGSFTQSQVDAFWALLKQRQPPRPT